MSPISLPIESQSPKVVSPQPEPTPRKQKTKTKTKTPVEKSAPKVKKAEPAVRIEPLVINDAFNSPDEDEDSFERMKKTDIKKGSSSKKGREFLFFCGYSKSNELECPPEQRKFVFLKQGHRLKL